MKRLLLLSLLSGCLMPRYLSQAAVGQLKLLHDARPIDEVVRDPDVPLATRELLATIPDIKAFARRKGLHVTRNYRTFVQLDHDYAVYFVGAAPPLSFDPKMWCFPIAGCFTGLGWFDEDDAIAFKDQLEAEGWDAMARPASAYSTGGWFPDPLLSSMLPEEGTTAAETGFADLANVFLHESTHATVFIPDEPYFNEGIAEYTGDHLARELVTERYGADSPELAEYDWELQWDDAHSRREMKAYEELDKVYKSSMPDAEKLKEKARIIDALVKELNLRHRPNNASLVELRVYLANYDAFDQVAKTCGGAAPMVAAAKQVVRRADFDKSLQESYPKVLAKIEGACRSTSEKVDPR